MLRLISIREKGERQYPCDCKQNPFVPLQKLLNPLQTLRTRHVNIKFRFMRPIVPAVSSTW
jgi:hypothetical protein